MTDEENPADWTIGYDKAVGGCDTDWHEITEVERLTRLNRLRQHLIDQGINQPIVDRELAKIDGFSVTAV